MQDAREDVHLPVVAVLVATDVLTVVVVALLHVVVVLVAVVGVMEHAQEVATVALEDAQVVLAVQQLVIVIVRLNVRAVQQVVDQAVLTVVQVALVVQQSAFQHAAILVRDVMDALLHAHQDVMTGVPIPATILVHQIAVTLVHRSAMEIVKGHQHL